VYGNNSGNIGGDTADVVVTTLSGMEVAKRKFTVQ
jgi:hypothetical protein